jgi:uncharacterized protein (DUF697 family)
MTRKQLPKVIRPTAADLPVIAAEPEAESRQSAALHERIQAPAGVLRPSAPPANDVLPAAAPNAQWLAEKRLREAFKIVGRHRIFAAAGGLFPMPAVNVVGVTAIILRMVKALGDLYGVPFERDQTHSIVLGLMGGAAPAGLGVATASTLAFVVPGAGAVGLVVSSVTAAALTRRIGVVFIERFEKSAAG